MPAPPLWMPIKIEISENGRVAKNKTVEEIFAELVTLLKKDGLYPDEGLSIMYMKEDQELPSYRWIACYPVTGGAEGHYIHVDIVTYENERIPVFIGKTFQGFGFAAKVAMACAKHLGA